MTDDIRLCVLTIVSFPLLTLALLGLGACAGEGGEDGPQIEGDFIWAVINEEKGYAYFRARGTVSTPKRAAMVAVGEGEGLPRFVGMVEVESEELQTARALTKKKGYVPRYRSRSAVDPANGYTYSYHFAPTPGRVVKQGGGRSSSVPLPAGRGYLRSGGYVLIDASRGFVYVGTARGPSIPAQVVKIAAGKGSDPLQLVGTLDLESGESNISCGVVDPESGYAYFGTTSGVVKIALGDGFEPPTRVGALVLDAVERRLQTAVIDTSNGYAYFANAYTIVKVALGEGAEPPARVGAITVHREPRQASKELTGFLLLPAILPLILSFLLSTPPSRHMRTDIALCLLVTASMIASFAELHVLGPRAFFGGFFALPPLTVPFFFLLLLCQAFLNGIAAARDSMRGGSSRSARERFRRVLLPRVFLWLALWAVYFVVLEVYMELVVGGGNLMASASCGGLVLGMVASCFVWAPRCTKLWTLVLLTVLTALPGFVLFCYLGGAIIASLGLGGYMGLGVIAYAPLVASMFLLLATICAWLSARLRGDAWFRA
jgi:hypothetical protein